MPFVPPVGTIDFKFTQSPGGASVTLPAYLQSIDTGFSGNWNTAIEIGRADPKYRYSEFGKTISINFQVVAESTSRNTMKCFDDLETLAKIVTPAYAGSGYVGSFVEFTIGKIYSREVGYVTNLTYNWDNTSISWDTRTDLPFYTDVSMEITWVGKGLAQKKYEFFAHELSKTFTSLRGVAPRGLPNIGRRNIQLPESPPEPIPRIKPPQA